VQIETTDRSPRFKVAQSTRIVESREVKKREGEEMLSVYCSSRVAGYLYYKKEQLGVRKAGSYCNFTAEELGHHLSC